MLTGLSRKLKHLAQKWCLFDPDEGLSLDMQELFEQIYEAQPMPHYEEILALANIAHLHPVHGKHWCKALISDAIRSGVIDLQDFFSSSKTFSLWSMQGVQISPYSLRHIQSH